MSTAAFLNGLGHVRAASSARRREPSVQNEHRRGHGDAGCATYAKLRRKGRAHQNPGCSSILDPATCHSPAWQGGCARAKLCTSGRSGHHIPVKRGMPFRAAAVVVNRSVGHTFVPSYC
jgi:hypothetical protein